MLELFSIYIIFCPIIGFGIVIWICMEENTSNPYMVIKYFFKFLSKFNNFGKVVIIFIAILPFILAMLIMICFAIGTAFFNICKYNKADFINLKYYWQDIFDF